jgi:hypothetical protein
MSLALLPLLPLPPLLLKLVKLVQDRTTPRARVGKNKEPPALLPQQQVQLYPQTALPLLLG